MTMSHRFPVIAALLIALNLPAVALAQHGSSQSGASRTRRLAEVGRIPAPEEIVVEHFVNYHRHGIRLPRAGEDIAPGAPLGCAGRAANGPVRPPDRAGHRAPSRCEPCPPAQSGHRGGLQFLHECARQDEPREGRAAALHRKAPSTWTACRS